ncbi:thiamine-repressible acid phosphatase pho4 [Verticillium alfalfae VaMs.102]|uniref:Thiamine-repressible acid phosphatase pho4 n=1 Tax=Verticillium alfalfae (strain VaMs.102 / ATCC MYA-4576 / FGSC 10136) TaxID=526221 RepID=C9SYR7_VERA1|nr:thiamine-repressible acid phosphatase pho4 [Verticillium alfalfae VaMs.102]EEY23932.1 thiamine-repressible acid phosphatase pho4 [Verticillium alfalfae VaMs.102]
MSFFAPVLAILALTGVARAAAGASLDPIAQLSKTGYKELYDMGYTLRTRYPDLYEEGDEFFVWANNYTRVLQTAQLFVRGYLGPNSTLLGNVVSVTGRGVPAHLGDTLAPSDMCPTFKDDSSKQTNAWRALWLPPFIKRLSQYIDGDLVLDDSHWNDFPYICGFESQITGRLSPFCDTFTQEELEQYEYHQDLRYYYGVGPAADVASKMMTPFLDSLVKLLAKGPGVAGSCAVGRYARFVADALEKNGDFAKLCNATDPATPKQVKGASFFTDLGQDHLQIVKP